MKARAVRCALFVKVLKMKENIFERVSPESVGMKSEQVLKFLRHVEELGLNTHSVLMMRGGKIFCEAYWKPFHKDFCHRMYSQTKSFVGIAIGLLEEEGKLRLSDKIADYFRDKIDGELPAYLEAQTIEETLTMRTSCQAENWFVSEDRDRVHAYFNRSKVVRPAGTVWEYDSAGSQVLCALVERLGNKPLLDYMKEKLFDEMGCFQTAQILKTPTGESWGDSALLCTARDMAAFGRLLLNGGKWKGKQLINADYVKRATSAVVSNCVSGHEDAHHCGYGYQIWRTTDNSFAFVGMGQQLTVCNEDTDIIFVCNSDNQGAYYPYDVTINYLFDDIVREASTAPYPENKEKEKELEGYISRLSLRAAKGKKYSSWQEKINGKKFVCPQSTNITSFTLNFTEEGGVFSYENEQGQKSIAFGLEENVYGKFPQEGYSNEVGGERTKGYFYDCVASAAWTGENQFKLYVQIIDKYFGNLTVFFAFKGEEAVVRMVKNAEAFLNEYQGLFVAKAE